MTESEASPLSAAHAGEAAHLLARAMRDDPSMLALFDGVEEEERQRRLTAFFAASLAACSRGGLPLEICEGGRVVAAGCFHPPGGSPPSPSTQLRTFARSVWHAGLLKRDTWTVMRCVLRMLDGTAKEHPKTAHYYLEWAGVLPGHQGRDLGSRLLGAALERADEERVGCHLETANPRNVTLYERLGFRTATEREILGVRLWFMWRDPQPPDDRRGPSAHD